MRKKILLSAILAIVCCLSCLLFTACKKKVTLSFETNGGNQIAAVEVIKGETYTLPQPQKDSFEFLGWYLSADFSGGKVESVKMDDNATVYAKWRQMAKIELDAKGGKLSVTSFTAVVGQKAMALIKNSLPKKDNAEFYAWYDGNRMVTEDTVVPASGLKLNAVYKYKYTISVRIADKVDETRFVEDQSRCSTGFELEGKAITAPKFSGLTLENGDGGKIVADSDNLFVFDYSREHVSVVFNSNYPGEAEDVVESKSVLFGEVVTDTLDDLTYDGYLFLGWSTEKDGDLDYPVYLTAEQIFNYDSEVMGARPKNADIVADGDVTLYGKWAMAYSNMFVGSDLMYVVEELADDEYVSVIYLYRGGKYYVGDEYSEEEKSFQFNVSDDVTLAGYIVSEGGFVYIDPERSGTYKLYSYEFVNGFIGVKAKVDENITMTFDESNGVVYSEKADKDGNITDEPKTSSGRYIINEGAYEVTFTEGEKAGQVMHCFRGKYGNENVFLVRNDEEYGKKYYRFIVNKNQLAKIDEQYGYYLLLDGFGNAVYVAQQSQQFIYNYENNEDGSFINIYSSSGMQQGAFRIVEQNGVQGYTSYNSGLKAVFRNGNETLTLDGSYGAVYFDGVNNHDGMFTLRANSALGGMFIEFCDSNEQFTYFIVKSTKNEDKTYTYSFEKVADNYAELTYVRGQNKISDRIMIINGETASVYALNSKKQYVCLASGTLTVVDGKYSLAVEQALSSDELAESELISASAGEDLAFYYEYCTAFYNISKVDFEVNTNYGVFYWKSLEYKDGSDNVSDATEYSDQTDNGATLRVFGNKITFAEDGETVEDITLGVFATYTDKDGETFTGLLVENDKFAYLSAIVTKTDSDGREVSATRNFGFDIDKTEKTFFVYDYLPLTAYAVEKNGNLTSNEYLELDGKGGAKHTVVTKTTVDGKEENVENTVNGTIAKTGDNVSGVDIYMFTPDDGSAGFETIIFAAGNYNAFAKKNDDFRGDYTFTAEDVKQTLSLDGFVLAKLSSEDQTSGNMYYFTTDVENQIMIVFSTQQGSYVYYIDLDKSNMTFNIRGSVYGSYLVLNNQSASGMWFELDGYGTVEDYNKNIAHAVIKDYERDENGKIVKKDKDGNVVTDGTGTPTEITVSDKACYKIDTEDGKTYVYIKYEYEEGRWKEYKGILTTVTNGNNRYAAFVEVKTEVEETYVNEEDWSMLILTSYGVARKIDGRTGSLIDGSYTLITKGDNGGLLYFSSTEGESGVYTYNTNNRTIRKNFYNKKGYYTQELYSFYFSEYGYANYAKGTTKITYFYDVDYSHEDQVVTLYYQDWYAANHNEYGFVKVTEFGAHTSSGTVKEWQVDETHPAIYPWQEDKFYPTTGASISFARDTASKDKFALDYDSKNRVYFGKISFTPNGSETFSIKAQIELLNADGTPFTKTDAKGEEQPVVYTGTIKREKITRTVGEGDDAQEVEELRAYLQLPTADGGNYNFDVNLSFTGELDSTYSVTAKEWLMSGSAHYYNEGMMNLYMTMFQGGRVDPDKIAATQALDYGSFTFKKVYDENGDEIEAERRVIATLTDKYCPLQYVNEEGKSTYYTFDGQQSKTFGEKGKDETLLKTTIIESVGFAYEGGAYKVKMTGKDGKIIVAAIKFTKSQYFSSYGFYFDSISNYSEFTQGEYTISAERTFFSETKAKEELGRLYWVNVRKGEDKPYAPNYAAYGYNGDDYDYDSKRIIVRKEGTTTFVDKNGKTHEDWFTYTASTYFDVKFSADASTTELYPAYNTLVSFTVTEMKTAYTADGVSFVEYTENENGEIQAFFYNEYLSMLGYNVNSVKESAFTNDGTNRYCTVNVYGLKETRYLVFVTKDGKTSVIWTNVRPVPVENQEPQAA